MLQAKVFNKTGCFMISKTYCICKTKGNQIIHKFAAQHKYIKNNETNISHWWRRLHWFSYGC